MKIEPYLIFDGKCEDAFAFYERCLGGKIEFMMRHSEAPDAKDTPPETRDKILHVRLVFGSAVLMGSDSPPGYYQKPAGVHVSLAILDPDEAERVFTSLAEGGVTQMPFQETFWAHRFGMVVDRYGIPWMVNCERPARTGA